MILRAALSSVLSLVLIGVAGLTLFQGVELTRFAALEAQAPEFFAARAEFQAALAAWQDVSAVQSRARALTAAMVASDSTATAADVESATARLLAIEPTSARDWLVLAQARWRRGAPVADVFSAVQMSRVTGPREAAVMLVRTQLLLRLWEQASVEDRSLALSELVEIRSRLDPPRVAQFKAILAQKPETTRSAIADGLAARLGDRLWLPALGL
jgi:hypothetical protein